MVVLLHRCLAVDLALFLVSSLLDRDHLQCCLQQESRLRSNDNRLGAVLSEAVRVVLFVPETVEAPPQGGPAVTLTLPTLRR